MSLFTRAIKLLIATIICLSFNSLAFAQKAKFEDVEIISFQHPYEKMTISYYGDPLDIVITAKTSLRGKGRKSLDPDQLEEGIMVQALTYELSGADYVATSIQTNISADGSIKLGGLFEGYFDGMPIIDGYPVVIAPGTKIEGSSRSSCDAKGLVVPSFKSPLIKPGKFYVTIDGRLEDNGTVVAKSVELCRNTFDEKDQAYLTSVSGSLAVGTTPQSNPNAELSIGQLSLFSGEVSVGDYTHKLSDNIRLQGYVSYVANKVIPNRENIDPLALGAINFRVFVVDNPVPNALALPNGMIFLHTGLLDIIDNEAQLAAIIGHEVAHVTHQHGKEKFESEGAVRDISRLGTRLVNRTINPGLSAAMSDLPVEMKLAVKTVFDAVSPTLISNVMHPQSKMESQADRLGLFYAYDAGYDVRECAKFWTKMEELTADASFQARVSSDFVNTLDVALSDRNRTIAKSMSLSATQVLTNEVLDNIYTSHPKARRRAMDINKMLTKVYQNAEWNALTIGQESYARAMR